MYNCPQCGQPWSTHGTACRQMTVAAPALTQQGDVVHERLVRALERIADAMEALTDRDKNALRMFDVERANVYKTHLGEKLKGEAP